MKYVIAGTAGHIDHGKSALIRALTGTDPDRLEEEKRRGITIDLGFAHLDLGDGLTVGFVDVPGHERFIKNMLAGVGGIDLVLLVIAADESIKPQTREHFDICRLLGIRRGIIVLTKSDLVEPEMLDLVKLEALDLVSGSFLEKAPAVAVSARTGAGLDVLKSELRRISLEVALKPADLPFRLPIDRAFVMKGFGTVVTGTLLAGTISKEAEAEVFPIGRRVRVRGIQVHNAPAEFAAAGQRTALNLAGIESKEIARGMVLAPPGMFESSARLDVSFTLLPSVRALKTRSRAHFHCGTAETIAQIILLGANEIKAGESGLAQLELAEPGLFLPGDRFIIRQFSPLITLGGGVVLDNFPSKHRAGDARALDFLKALAAADADSRVGLVARRAGEMTLAQLIARTGRDPASLIAAGKALEAKGELALLGQPPALFVHAEYSRGLASQAMKELDSFHAANPLVAGIPKEELRQRVALETADGRTPPSSQLFDAVLATLAEKQAIEIRGESVRRAGREIQLSSEEARATVQIEQAFESAGLAVPAVGEVLGRLPIERRRADMLLQILVKQKTLVRISEDLVFHRAALDQLRATLARRKAQTNRINVTAFKELTGLSRKYTIPLLEYLDRERVTRREGDDRIIL